MLKQCMVCLFLMTLLSPLYGLTQNGRLNSIEQRLMTISAYSEKLEEQSAISERISIEKEQRAEKMLRELGGLREELKQQRLRLEASETWTEQYGQRIAGLLGIISELETRLKQLSKSFESTVQPLKEALVIAERQIRVQRVKTVIWSIIVGVLGVAAGLGLSVVF